MMRSLCAIVLALTLATSAEAMTAGPLSEPDGMITKIASPCGSGHMRVRGGRVRGVCATRTIPGHHVRRCVERHAGVCVRYR
jgi:hypothetical protein